MPSHVVVNSGVVASDLIEASRVTFYSQNFCDKCTWYSKSTGVEDEELTPDGSYETYSAAHDHWIDLYHARVSDEDDLVESYPIVVKVNGQTKTMDTPLGPGADGDFSIDPVNGEITFHEALTSEDVVTATYHYATTSEWIMAPEAGKNIELLSAECQMSKNITINDTIKYTIYVGETPVKVKKYKSALDFIAESNGAYPLVPAFGGAKRGLSSDMLIFPWLYKSKTTLHSALDMKVAVELDNDVVCTGEAAIVAFYCISKTA